MLSLGGALILVAIWFVFLFGSQPECFNSFEIAIHSISYALSPSESGTRFFIYVLSSIVMCIMCAVLLLTTKKAKLAMWLVIIHSIAAMFIYTWSLVVAIAMPLVYFNKVVKNA